MSVVSYVSVCELEEGEVIITKSPTFQKVLARAVAEYEVNVLIEGETGTGKSLLLYQTHCWNQSFSVMQEKEFERLGDTKTRKVDLRIIAPTNKNLKELMKQGHFRKDLYYHL